MNEIVASRAAAGAEKPRRPLIKGRPRAPWIILIVFVAIGVPTLARGQFSVFNSIFSSIQSDMGSSLKSINQIVQQMQKLYQTTMYPIAQLNQARGFVSSSITSYRAAMNHAFTTPFNSAVTQGPQQFELLLHSRQLAEIPSLGSSFVTNYGAVPQNNVTSPQDRVLLDMDDALGQQNLKTTLISDQADDAILQTANQMENQVALSTPGSNPYLTAQTQIVNLRCQAYMQMMLAAELRQEAGRIAHDNALVKRKATVAGNLKGLVGGALTAH